MPLKIQNYGDWRGDRRSGHHPPACTCYRCNEERRRLEASNEEERRVAEYDRRVAESQRRTKADHSERGKNKPTRPGGGQTKPRTTSQQRATEAVQQSVAGTLPVTRYGRDQQRGSSSRPEGKLYGLTRAITASALRYALALHAVAILGVVVYALVQGGTSNVMPTLDSATKAYVQGWDSMGTIVGL